MADLLTFAGSDLGDPWWLGYEILHVSHRACLFIKDFEHYDAFMPDAMRWVAIYRKYAWPTERDGVRGFSIHPSPEWDQHGLGAVFRTASLLTREEVADA